MKRVLFSLAVAAASIAPLAHAEVIAYLPNEAGGTIRLTDERRDCPSGTAYMFTVIPAGNAMAGCWTTYDRFVSVTYSDGAVRMHPLSDWYLTAYGTANGWAANKPAPARSTERVRPAPRTQGVDL